MLPPSTVSLPFKLVFFVLVDGWFLVSGSLVQSFGGTGGPLTARLAPVGGKRPPTDP